MPELSPQDINAARPFSKAARVYLRKGWMGPVPLPPKHKNPPPTGYSGRGKPYPDDEQIDRWVVGDDIDWSSKKEFRSLDPRKANIGLRLGSIEIDGKIYDVLGIDVDDYNDGGKRKTGAEQFRELADRLGTLPETYVSSSREGSSGIRFYLAPAGHVYKGKASRDIDIVSPGYRFAVVYPSYHPSGGQYRWRDQRTDEYVSDLKSIPSPRDLPFLPDKWFQFLTNGGTVDDGRPIDMDTSRQDIENWARQNFPKPPKDGSLDEYDGLCSRMQKAVTYWTEKIDDDPSSHDKMIGSHWNIISLAVEGHSGWEEACRKIESYQLRDVAERGKRTLQEIKQERFRSRINALRKKKADADEHALQGIEYISKSCSCFSEKPTGKDRVYHMGEVLRGKAREEAEKAVESPGASGRYPRALRSGPGADPLSYARNDVGNGDHFFALYEGHFHWVSGIDMWMFWDGVQWLLDDIGIAERSWRLLLSRLEEHANTLLQTAAADPDDKAARRAATSAIDWATKCGDNRRFTGAMENVKSRPGVSIRADELDGDPNVLGLPDGEILLLQSNGVKKRLRTIYDLVTKSSAVTHTPFEDVPGKQKKMWADYLDQFLPDPELRAFVQKLAGYSIIGGNPKKMCVFLLGPTQSGKSTFLDTLMGALGEYAAAVDMDMFRQHERNPGLVSALPRRVITASEVSQANVVHADVFKRITGGDRISARKLFSNDIVEMRPSFTPIIATNSAPSIKNADEAVLQRLCVVPFLHQSSADKSDKKDDLVSGALDAVLSWMIEGYVQWRQDPASINRSRWPSAVQKATKKFFLSTFDLGDYLDDRVEHCPPGLEMHKDWRVSFDAMYMDYEAWCAANGVRDIMTKNKFSRELTAQGIRDKILRNPEDGKNLRYRYAIRLLPIEDSHVVSVQIEGTKKDGS